MHKGGLDFRECQLCGSDGLKLVPIKNVARHPLAMANGQVVPEYFTKVVPCECRANPYGHLARSPLDRNGQHVR